MRLLVGSGVVLGLLAFMLVLTVFVEPDAERAAAQDGVSGTDDGFTMSEPAQNVIVGSLERPGMPTASFRSKVTVEDPAGPADADRFAITRVEAGDIVIDAKRNLRTGVITAGGHGKSMTRGAQEALLAVCRELEGSLGNLGTPMPPEEDQLVRTACYYAEAPVNHDLHDRTEKPEPVSFEDEAPAAQADTYTVTVAYRQNHSMKGELANPAKKECVRVEAVDYTPATEDFAIFVSCQVNDNDGVRYISCSYREHDLYHDSNVDCFHFRQRPTGPCTDLCKGRCGPDCGVSGTNGVYTRDCAEHDDCYWDHQNCDGRWSNDRCCGDEYDEAFDDVFYGDFNCQGCNNPAGWFSSNPAPVLVRPEALPAAAPPAAAPQHGVDGAGHST